MSDAFKPLLAKLADGATLNGEDAEQFFAACLRGEPTPAQVAAAVTAIRLRGETVNEIAACAKAMRAAAIHLDHPYDVVDVCGTGGDGLHTLNISTAVGFVAAGGGLKVAKHGNRAITSKSGTADVLAALGVNIEATLVQQRRALDEAGICFLFAQAHHGAMRHVSPIRQQLGFRTIFNLLGPLSNPAGARFCQGAGSEQAARQPGADRRSQEGLAVQGADSRGLRSAGSGARLRIGWRLVSVDPDRQAVLHGR